MEFDHRYASRGKGNTGVALGATGLGVAVLDWLCGGQRGGYCCSEDEPVTRYEAEKDAKIAAKDSEIALLKSEQNTEVKIADVYERLDRQIRVLENKVNENTCGQAVTNQQVSDNIRFVDSKFDGVYKAIADGDARERCYVDCHFVPGVLNMPLGKICPKAAPLCPPAPVEVKVVTD